MAPSKNQVPLSREKSENMKPLLQYVQLNQGSCETFLIFSITFLLLMHYTHTFAQEVLLNKIYENLFINQDRVGTP